MPLGALAQETITAKRQFLRTAFSDFPDSRKEGLRKASLLCIKNCRFRGLAQLRPGGFGGAVRAKSPASLTACRAFFMCQALKPMGSCAKEPFRIGFIFHNNVLTNNIIQNIILPK